MKKIFTSISAISLALSISLATDHGNMTAKNTHNASMSAHIMDTSTPSGKILADMHTAMIKAEFSESSDVELDFLLNMIPHHQGAVDSSKELLKHSKNEQIRKIAETIIKDQEKEILDFTMIIKDKKYISTQISDTEYKKFVSDEKQFMASMMDKMSAVKPSENLDKNFLEAMIEHHQGAVDVSKQILEYSQDETIRKIAQNIIQAQEKEIAEFGEIIKNL